MHSLVPIRWGAAKVPGRSSVGVLKNSTSTSTTYSLLVQASCRANIFVHIGQDWGRLRLN